MKSFGVLDRMVIRSVVTPSVLAFVIYTFLLMMRSIFSLMDQVFVRGLPFADAIKIIIATVPHVVVLTIPMSYLFGVLLAVGRMNGDNEIVALQAGGISSLRLLRPVMLMALLLTVFNGYLFLQVIPESSQKLREVKTEMFTSARNIGRIEPQVFYEDFPNLLLYVKDVDQESGTWLDVMVYDTSDVAEERLTLARRGRVVVAPEVKDSKTESTAADSNEPWLLLEDVVTHQFLRDKPATYRVNANQSQLIKVTSSESATVTYRRAARERSTVELVSFLRYGSFSDETTARETNPEKIRTDRRLAELELHRRMAIPAACITFALLALPLGVGTGSGAKGRGFVLSIVVILVYYVASNNGELLAMKGKVPPWLGMWFPNIGLAALAILLMGRMGRWLGERGSGSWVAYLGRRWIEWRRSRRLDSRHGRRNSRAQLTGSIPVRLQRKRYVSGFPTLFDRHLTRRLLGPLLLVLISVAALYVVVDLSGNLDDIAKNKVPSSVAVAYYLNKLPQIIMDVTPMGLMIAVLILLTVLERQRELTAFKGAGVSLYRVMLPVVLIAMVSVGVLWVLEESVVPEANREAKRLHDRIKGRDTPRSYRINDRLWLLSRDGSAFYKFLRYDTPSETLVRFTMFKVDESMGLRFHLSAHRVRYLNGGWVADSGWFRQFFPDGTDLYKKITGPLELGIPEGPGYFGQEYRRPAEMSFKELGAYIKELDDSGYRPAKLIVRYHQKLIFPLSALILVLLALPFGLNRGGRRVTTMQGVALALGLGIGYIVMVRLFEQMGQTDLLPPVVGAWSPVALAVLFAVNRLTSLRT